MNIRNQIKAISKAKKIPLTKIDKKAKTGHGSLSKFIRGHSNPTLDRLERWADVLGVKILLNHGWIPAYEQTPKESGEYFVITLRKQRRKKEVSKFTRNPITEEESWSVETDDKLVTHYLDIEMP